MGRTWKPWCAPIDMSRILLVDCVYGHFEGLGAPVFVSASQDVFGKVLTIMEIFAYLKLSFISLQKLDAMRLPNQNSVVPRMWCTALYTTRATERTCCRTRTLRGSVIRFSTGVLGVHENKQWEGGVGQYLSTKNLWKSIWGTKKWNCKTVFSRGLDVWIPWPHTPCVLDEQGTHSFALLQLADGTCCLGVEVEALEGHKSFGQ